MKKKKTRFLFENIGGNGFKLVKELGIGPKPPPGDEFETWGSKNKDLMVVYHNAINDIEEFIEVGLNDAISDAGGKDGEYVKEDIIEVIESKKNYIRDCMMTAPASYRPRYQKLLKMLDGIDVEAAIKNYNR